VNSGSPDSSLPLRRSEVGAVPVNPSPETQVPLMELDAL
jgi:hypothetical protein